MGTANRTSPKLPPSKNPFKNFLKGLKVVAKFSHYISHWMILNRRKRAKKFNNLSCTVG
jgi:hypothetical protein